MSESAGQADGHKRGEPEAPGDVSGAGGDAALLSEMKMLRRQARAARHAYWFPLPLFGILTCLSAPFYVQRTLVIGPAGYTGGTGAPLVPVLGSASDGVTQQDLVGFALAIPLLSQVRSPHWLSWLQHLNLLWPGDLMVRGTFPFVIIAVGLWVLARAERSLALAVIAAVYTGAALLASLYDVENVLFRLGWNPSTPGEWDLTSLPNVLLPALVLLAAGAGAFAVQRRHRLSTSGSSGSSGAAQA